MTTKELIAQTKRLITIPSTADNPSALRAAVDFIVDIVARCPDVNIERFERDGKPSFLAYRGKIRPEKFDILLNAHVDVVPGKSSQFKPIEKNGRLYGRGALDMKGTALALTDVFCELVDEVPYNLALQIVSDEEVGGYNGVRLQLEQGVRARFVIMGEYSNDRHTIYNAARGLCWAEIAFKGKGAHSGHLWHGDNAVVRAGDFAGAVLKRFPTPDKETWTTTASIASLSTPNQTYNRVPDEAVLKIDFRFTQEDPVFHSEDALRAFIASIDASAEVVNLATFEPAVKVEELNPYVQGLSAAMHKVTKASAQFLGRPGGSDGRHYALYGNDTVEFGLYGRASHADGEYVELSSFDEYRAIVRNFLRDPIPVNLKSQPVEPLHLTLLRQLVAMPTVTGDHSASNNCLAFIEQFLRDRGMFVEHFEHGGFHSMVATTKPGNKKPAVLLNAHIDVVPADEQHFKLQVKGDKLLGRGVMDMKVAVASYMMAVDALRDELDQYDFGIMLTSDEEVGGKDGVGRLVEELGYHPNVVIVPDGGENWQIETFAKGVQWVKLEASGKTAHASRPWEGDNAIDRLLGVIKDIAALMPLNPDKEGTFMTVGTIEGGTTANQIAAGAKAMLDIRYGNRTDYEQLYPRIKKACEKHGVSSVIVASSQPFANDPENEFIKPFIDIVADVTGKRHGHSLSYGVTDGRYFNAAGIPCIIIQPPGGGRHQDSEWLSKEGFGQFCTVIEQYVRKIAATAPKVEAAPESGDIASLAKRLNAAGRPAYVWYATFASGLSKENFMHYITGGTQEGALRPCAGCRDKTPPVEDVFISLPHELYFSGESRMWAGGQATLDVKRSVRAHAIARAYLITIEQFEDIAAQENLADQPVRLPLAKAMRNGHATIDTKGARLYDELLYCGMRDEIPIFTLTALRPRFPYRPPAPIYPKVLCSGLSQNPALSPRAVVDYIISRPGIAGYYKRQAVNDILNEQQHAKRGKHTSDGDSDSSDDSEDAADHD